MQLTPEQIRKYYAYARSIAGKQGPELFHHILTEIRTDAVHFDSYIFKAMRNAFFNPRSVFNKLHNPQFAELTFDCPELEQTDFPKYDANLLHKILLQLEIEGHGYAVSVFKDCTFCTSARDLSDRIGVNRRTIAKIINFVESEIRKRYELLDTNT